MTTPTVLKNGVSTAETGVFKSLPFLDPTGYYTYFNDFIQPKDFLSSDWTITKTEAGAGSATHVIDNAAGGVLLITNDAADDDKVSIQMAVESFKLVSGQKAFFEARVKLGEVLQSDFLIGLVITDTDPMTSFTDGIVFKKDDGDANVDFSSLKNSAGTTGTAITTLSDDTYAKLGFYFDGTDIIAFKDGEQIARYESATICDDEELTLTIHIQNGEAANKNCSVDYVFVAIER